MVNPRAAGIVDDGDSYGELRGALLHGTVEPADEDAALVLDRHLNIAAQQRDQHIR